TTVSFVCFNLEFVELTLFLQCRKNEKEILTMRTTQDTLNILTAQSYKGIGPKWIVDNYKKGISEHKLVAIIAQKDPTIDEYGQDFATRRQMISDFLDKNHQENDFAVSFVDDDFPKMKNTLPIKPSKMPVVLFGRGDLSILSKKSVAVIGVLNPEPEIVDTESRVVKQLVENGLVIVSGLAFGCDSVSHITTLSNHGKTVAILPDRLCNIQPAKNDGLANQIVEQGGLLITEYYRPVKSKFELVNRYIDRDRLQAYFSNLVLLSASYDENKKGNDCGSRHALASALEVGIMRGVIYNPKTDAQNEMFDLNRRIIKEGKCQIVQPETTQKLIDYVYGQRVYSQTTLNI
ncbi:MAG: DNA-processing protein DprA, partial [Bacteroidales bacterium]|nr:DNA-processing protein DprA [Bacteroidales bacterium]